MSHHFNSFHIFAFPVNNNMERWCFMIKQNNKEKTVDNYSNKEKTEIPKTSVEPLPESTRPRQDGPGGN